MIFNLTLEIMIVAEIQKNSLKEQRIQFIRNHQQAFDVEPIYPLRLFEDFVMEVEGDCNPHSAP